MVDEEILIEIVRNKPVLYDLSHPDYMKTKLKDEIWGKIGAEIGSDGSFVYSTEEINYAMGQLVKKLKKEDILCFMAQKNKIESELVDLNAVLDQNNVGLDDPLVDAHGSPRNDIDVSKVRRVRNKIIRLKNDLKCFVKYIEDASHNLNLSQAEVEFMETNGTLKAAPILEIGSVSQGSPVDRAGLQDGDLIIEFGTVNAKNFTSIVDVSKVLEHSVNSSVDLKVERQGRILSLQVSPRPWSGQGILGCLLLPPESIER